MNSNGSNEVVISMTVCVPFDASANVSVELG